MNVSKLEQEINILVINEFSRPDDTELFFSEPVHQVRDKDLLDILVDHSFFLSKSQARKAGWDGSIDKKPCNIPPGFSEFTIGKRKRRLIIFNPTELNLDGKINKELITGALVTGGLLILLILFML